MQSSIQLHSSRELRQFTDEPLRAMLMPCSSGRRPGSRSSPPPSSPWTLEEIQTDLRTGLEAVGIHRSPFPVFEPAAVDLLVRATAGVPRSVCLLARAAWLEAARAEATQINAPILQQALEQVPGLAGLARHNPSESESNRLTPSTVNSPASP